MHWIGGLFLLATPNHAIAFQGSRSSCWVNDQYSRFQCGVNTNRDNIKAVTALRAVDKKDDIDISKVTSEAEEALRAAQEAMGLSPRPAENAEIDEKVMAAAESYSTAEAEFRVETIGASVGSAFVGAGLGLAILAEFPAVSVAVEPAIPPIVCAALLGGGSYVIARRDDRAGQIARNVVGKTTIRVGESIANAATNAVDGFVADIKAIPSKIQAAAQRKADEIASEIEAIPSKAKEFAQQKTLETAEEIKRIPQKVSDAAADAAEDLRDAALDAAEDLADEIKATPGKVADSAKKAVERTVDDTKQKVNKVVDDVVSLPSRTIDDISSFLEGGKRRDIPQPPKMPPPPDVIAETSTATTEPPQISLPKVEVPEISLPKVEVPEISVPDISVPEISVPKIDLPKIDLPSFSGSAVQAPSQASSAAEIEAKKRKESAAAAAKKRADEAATKRAKELAQKEEQRRAQQAEMARKKQIAAAKAEAAREEKQAREAERKRKQEEAVLTKKRQQELAEKRRREQETLRKAEEAMEKARAADKRRKEEARKRQEEAAERQRQQEEQRAAAEQARLEREQEAARKKAENERIRQEETKRREAEAKKRAIEAEKQRKEVEARKKAADAAKQKEIEAKRREAEAKKKAAQAEARRKQQAKSKAVVSTASRSQKVSPPKLTKAPRGVPTIVKWRRRRDGGISGRIYGSPNFGDGDRIETSPIAGGGSFTNGIVVKTDSGSRYFLSDTIPASPAANEDLKNLLNAVPGATITLTRLAKARDAKAALDAVKEAKPRSTFSLFGLGARNDEDEEPKKKPSPVTQKGGYKRSAPRGVPTMRRWRKNRDGSITGQISGSPNFREGEKVTTSPISGGKLEAGEVVKTSSGSRYFLD